MSGVLKIDQLNHLETLHDELVDYAEDMAHDIYSIAEADSRYFNTPSHPSGRDDTGEGCGIDAAKVDGYTLAQILAAAIPFGGIGMWKEGALPNGFVQCDGLNGTPNLQGYYPRGAGGGLSPGDVGGANTTEPTVNSFNSPSHTLSDNEIPKHQHSYLDWTNTTVTHTSSSYYYRSTGVATKSTTTTQPGGVVARTGHTHDDCLFAWAGYLDDDGAHQAGDLDIRPLSRAVTFIMRTA